MYKVVYTKLAKMPDGSIGNLSQGIDTCYTDSHVDNIRSVINDNLTDQVCSIKKITKIEGHVIQVSHSKGE